jgi:hypothetical protein
LNRLADGPDAGCVDVTCHCVDVEIDVVIHGVHGFFLS